MVAKPGDAVKLDPADITEAQSAQVTENIFDTLVEYKDGKTSVQPALASSWQHSKNGKIWIFHLRQGVKFQDGTPFNADAVAFNFQRQMDARNPYHAFGKFIYWQTMWGGYPGIIRKVRAVDSHTVRFTLSRPVAPFLANMAMFCFAISSPSAIEKWGADYFKHPVGTGPFKLALWEKGERIVLEANPDYWGGKPKINRLIFQPVADDTTRKLLLERGAVDFITNLSPEDAAEARKNRNLRVDMAPGMNISYVAMNCQKPPFTDSRVRQAVRYAVNKKKIIKNLFQNMAVSAVGPLPPGILGYDKNLKDFPFDPQKAKSLLRQAGYPHGFATSLWYIPMSRDYIPEPKSVAEAIQADLGRVGIKAALLTFDWGTYIEKTENGEHAMAMLGWVGDNGDPDNFLYALLDKDNAVKPAQNVAFYANPAVDALLLRAQSEINPAMRARLYLKVQKIINKDSPWLPIAHADQIVAYSRKVSGFKLHPTGMLRFRAVKILP